jgi:hypothetical protein
VELLGLTAGAQEVLMSLSPEDLDAIAERVTTRLSDASATGGWLRTAGEAIGLIAGAVAFVYVLGGLVIALRMIFDRFTLEETVGLIGQLPREFVVTAGFVEVIGISGLIGLIAGLGLAAFGKPMRDKHYGEELWPNLRHQPPLKAPRWVWLIAPAVVAVAPAAVLELLESEASTLVAGVVIVIGLVVSYGAGALGWLQMRRLGREGRAFRASVGGLIWAVMLAPGVIAFDCLGGFGGTAVTSWIAAAAGVTVVAGLVALVLLANRPRRDVGADEGWSGFLRRDWQPATWFWLIGLALLFAAPSAAWVVLTRDLEPLPSVVAVVATAAASYAAVCLGWYSLRQLGMTPKDGKKRSRRLRAFLGALVWAGMTIPGVIVFVSLVGFEQARVCIRGSDKELRGRLVANTGEQILLVRREQDPERRSVVTVPGDRVERLD